MARERLVTGKPASVEEEKFTWSLRPKTLKEYIGQEDIVEKLSISIEASKRREEPQEHLLLHGPPGLGKTTLAHIISEEMNCRLITSAGPSLTKIADLMGILTNLDNGDIFFIDEIHRLPKTVEEFIYPAMEDFKVDFVIDKGPFSKVINVPLKRFTIVGATTRVGLLSSPFRDRFGITYHLDFYPDDDMYKIVLRSAKLLKVSIDEKGAKIVAGRSRGTPRIANRLLRRVRDYALVRGDGNINEDIANKSLDMEGIDSAGLDSLDRKFLKVIIDYYNGGPVGIEAVSATLSEEVNTIEELVEPYLLKTGFLMRTKRGRTVGRAAYKHFGLPVKGPTQGNLFD
ncbi:Holliday junction branch migration DNA helicase RuvB [Candidatus Latescibacterota bacterium]